MRGSMRIVGALSLCVLLVTACTEDPSKNEKPEASATMKSSPFGKLSDGREIEIHTLTNRQGLEARITNFGAILVSLKVPDREGKLENVVLGFDDLKSYEGEHPYFGATVGRFANRIAGGKFELDGKEYSLATNNGPNHLHGGAKGFDKAVWRAERAGAVDGVSVSFTHSSPDGDENYPGELRMEVEYTLTNSNELIIQYRATTTVPTPVNLTHHSYFNLGGAGSGDILGHELTVNASRYLPTDDTLIPTGELASVEGTPLDFRQAKTIGERIGDIEGDHFAGGYDHCFVLDKPSPDELTLAARVRHPGSGRIMEVHTTEPGLQLYTGNFLDGSLSGSGGRYDKHAGLCLEAQEFPDAPNKPQFPNCILRPGETYSQRTVHRFTTE